MLNWICGAISQWKKLGSFFFLCHCLVNTTFSPLFPKTLLGISLYSVSVFLFNCRPYISHFLSLYLLHFLAPVSSVIFKKSVEQISDQSWSNQVDRKFSDCNLCIALSSIFSTCNLLPTKFSFNSFNAAISVLNNKI